MFNDPLLLTDEQGSIRIGKTRVLLELVIRAYDAGSTPEEIAQRFDTLTLADVFAVLAYNLRHRQEVEEYLRRREIEAQEIRKRIEADLPQRLSKEELMARWAARQGQ